jgi:hypothetical protein
LYPIKAILVSNLIKSLIKQQRYLTDIVGVSEEAAEAIMDMNAGIASRDVGKDAKVTAEQLEESIDFTCKGSQSYRRSNRT